MSISVNYLSRLGPADTTVHITYLIIVVDRTVIRNNRSADRRNLQNIISGRRTNITV